MRAALLQASLAAAQGEVPVGAVVTRGGAVLCESHNLVEQRQDPTAHAEMLCIRAAAERLGAQTCHCTVSCDTCPEISKACGLCPFCNACTSTTPPPRQMQDRPRAT